MEWRSVKVWVDTTNPEENRCMKRKLIRLGLKCTEFPVAIDFVASHPTFTTYVDFFAAKKSAARSLQEAKQEKADISICLQSAVWVIVTSKTELDYFLDVNLDQGLNDQRRIHVHMAEIQPVEASGICLVAIAAGLTSAMDE
ncbi:hypothetical protein L3X38_044169 [Prunus dulcis]|uniref:Uncharacterized protein n=1 Tax=Prunus dulcis TaxID=3755 RepID=A0AAD4YNN4_PRUDU|nr:hypothetical protein L3X38_044169 [Prunus dulcis]